MSSDNSIIRKLQGEELVNVVRDNREKPWLEIIERCGYLGSQFVCLDQMDGRRLKLLRESNFLESFIRNTQRRQKYLSEMRMKLNTGID